MKYSQIVKSLEMQGFNPRQSDFCRVLNLSRSVVSARVKNDSNFSDEEIAMLEECWALKIEEIQDLIELDYFSEIYASCGFGSDASLEKVEKLKVAIDNIENYSTNKKYSVINAYGNSMMPYIHDMDKLIVEHIDDNSIIDDRIYIFRYNNEIYVKRLVNNITEIIAKSDNTEYRPIALEKNTSDFKIIGQIVGLIRSF